MKMKPCCWVLDCLCAAWESSAQTVSARRERAAADYAKILVEVAAFAAAGANWGVAASP